MDLILELPHIIYIIEVKVVRSPEKGLDQIEKQKYFEPFLHKKKKISAIGISFIRKKAKKHGNSNFTISYATKALKI